MRTGRKRAFVRTFSVAMAIMLLFSYGWTGLGSANAKSKSGVSDSLHKTNVQSKNTMSHDLEKQFKKHDQVTFLLKFKDQVNTKKVAQKALSKKQLKTLTTAKADLMKRSAIVSALRNKANETQYNVEGFLKKEEKAGSVKNFNSYFIVNMMAVTGTKKVAEKLSKMDEIEKVLPNRTRHIIKQPKKVKKAVNSATKKAKEKEKINDDDAIEPNIKHIGAPQAWDQGIDGTGTVVGSIDTGVQWDHPALIEKYRGYIPDDPDHPDNEMNWLDVTAGKDTPYDDDGHGTHTVGTMVGSEPDGHNQIGVAPGAKWIAAKAFTPDGGKDADLLEAGQWMLAPVDSDGNTHPEMAPDVINNSWGSNGAGKDEFYRDMVKNWREAGIFPAFAAGNVDDFNPGGEGSVSAPGNYPESYAVGATDNDDNLARFSLRGPSPYDEIKPEVAAPGVNIRSSVPGNQYDGSYSGTSMATPSVSGTVALLRQADSSLTVDDLEGILMETAKPLTDDEYPNSPNNGYGHGGLQAGNAVASVTSGLGKIKGTVSHNGEDNEPPTFHHKAPDQVYSKKDIPLEINVKDNIGVDRVKVQYLSSKNDDWQTAKAERVNGDHKDGTYDVTIPADAVKGPFIEYRWHIDDYAGNDVTTDIYKVDVKPGITTGYSTDFETTPVGWRSYGFSNTWEWGKPTSGPQKAYSGDKVYATKLDDAYPNRTTTATLEMPPIDVPEGETYLRFKQWYSLPTIEIGEDEIPLGEGYVNISTDQKNWTRLGEFEKDSDGWEDGEFRLSEYAGQRVYIAFLLASLGNTGKQGWYLDDVKLSDTSSNHDTKDNQAMKKNKAKKKLKKAFNGNKITSKKWKKLNQKLIDLRNMKPGMPKNVKSPLDSHQASKKKDVSSLPVDATVSVKETGASTKTNPDDGSYSLIQPAGDYTLEANAYGFHSKTKPVDVSKDKTKTANFTLQAIQKGTLEGTITDKQSGDPIHGARVSLTEDAAIKPVQTDKDGHFSMKAYKGDYTMHVSDPKHRSKDTTITIKGDDTTTQNIKLKPFIGTSEKEIGYDDGTAENARAFYDAGNKWGVRMSLSKGHDSAMVTGGKFKFSNAQSPDPRDNKFQVEIWDASGKNGAPGEKLAGPIDATAIRDGTKWTKVDLENQAVVVNGDFYMVYVQTEDANKDVPEAPYLSTDEDGPNAHRSWQNVRGDWSRSPNDEGNFMIRALVDYEVPPPEITSPKDDSYTNDDSVTVKGKSSPGVDITVSNNGDETATTSTNGDGGFSVDVDLEDGENKLTATASTDSDTTEPSQPVIVTLDQENPDLTITSPKNRMKTNKMAVKVKGTVKDNNLSWVKVNGQKADLKDDGSYSYRMLLDEGENNISVVAEDKVGNKAEKNVTVFAKFDAPEISNLTPTEDKHLRAGESVVIEMDSEPGLKATFAIRLPLANSQGGRTSSIDELPMMKTSDGHYRGVWTATSDVKAEGAKIEVMARDDYGNKTNKLANGELYIRTEGDTIESAKDLDKRVKDFEEFGDITSDSAARLLHMHLTLVGRFEDRGVSDKVIKHLKGFKTLLDHQKNNKQITNKSYESLKSGAVELIRKWNK